MRYRFCAFYIVSRIKISVHATFKLDSCLQIICAAWLNLIGSAVRNLTAFDFVPVSSRFAVLMVGQTIAACGQTFIMFTPTKVAAVWFADSQRAIATTLTTMGKF